MSKYKAISENEQSIIVRNILNAKDKREQVQIEADLHETSVDIIKDILKEHDVNLRILNGGSRKKKHIEDELSQEIITPVEDIEAAEERAEADEIGQAWADLSIPPEEPVPVPTPAEQAQKIPYTKPEILDGPPQAISSETEENAADSIDIDLSYQRFKRLISEKMHCEDRLEEINAELKLYRDTCNSILIDLKEGGIAT